jgi:hypothetical protein
MIPRAYACARGVFATSIKNVNAHELSVSERIAGSGRNSSANRGAPAAAARGATPAAKAGPASAAAGSGADI